MCADTVTANYGFTKPEPGAAPTTWGVSLNTDLDSIDGILHTLSTTVAVAGSDIGDVKMFAGAAAPANWILCQGQSLLRAGAYASLFAVIGVAYGSADGSHFNLPDLRGAFPIGVDGTTYLRGSTGGEATHVLTIGQTPVHSHGITDPTHTHAFTGNAHNHGDPGHTHGVGDPGHAHQTNSNLTRAAVGAGADAMGGSSPGITSTTNATGISIGASGSGLAAATASGTNTAAATGVTTQNTGSGNAHNNLPPYVGINFVIRYA